MATPLMSTSEELDIRKGIHALSVVCHRLAKQGGWWTDHQTGLPLHRNRGELLMLMVSELAEAMEGERKGLMDEHLPTRPSAEVELADCLIRIGDYSGGFGYDLAGAIIDKLHYNSRREDHKPAARLGAGGKKF